MSEGRSVRKKVARIVTISRLVGPRPLMLGRTFLFLAGRGWRRRRLRRLYGRSLPHATVTTVLPSLDIPSLGDLPDELRCAAERLRKEADAILAHRVDFLGSGLTSLGDPIDWHRDFKSGYRWPAVFYQELEVTRLDDSSDPKIPWELSRCHHLLTLARAARIFGDARYGRELERQLDSWLTANPPGIGINWVNPMEAGIRAVNVVWALATLAGVHEIDPTLQARILTSLRWHGTHIRANLEGTPFLRSNHYLGDILGLLVLGAVLVGDPAAPGWFDFAHREFEQEILKQVTADGVSFEASLSYHALAMEIFAIAKLVAEWKEQPLSRMFDERLRQMEEVARTVRHEDGRLPLFGDQDSGRILPEGFDRPPTADNVLWLASAVMLERRPFDLPAPAEVAWALGVDRWLGLQRLPTNNVRRSFLFPVSGLCVMRSDRLHLVTRCGGVGQNGSGGHSHNDILSFELSLDRVPLIVDSGTYSYTFDVAARNAFRSTRAHNTIMVDGEEINPIVDDHVFELHAFARPRIEHCDLDADPMTFRGMHDGYRRLRSPASHSRTFIVSRTGATLRVEDEVGGGGMHVIESFLHFAPGTDVEIRDATLVFERDGVRGQIEFLNIEPDELRLGQASVSERYGIKTTAPALVVRARRQLPTRLGYTVVAAEAGTNCG